MLCEGATEEVGKRSHGRPPRPIRVHSSRLPQSRRDLTAGRTPISRGAKPSARTIGFPTLITVSTTIPLPTPLPPVTIQTLLKRSRVSTSTICTSIPSATARGRGLSSKIVGANRFLTRCYNASPESCTLASPPCSHLVRIAPSISSSSSRPIRWQSNTSCTGNAHM